MLSVVLFFLFFSLLLYVLLGGADFGAGIVELFTAPSKRNNTREVIYRVIGPIWEANHIWLIILLVILWTAFPGYFYIIVTYLHIPLALVLLGITIRGVAFVFRHYDAVIDQTQFWYNWLFRIGSLLTPIFLGITFGGLVGGRIIISEDYQNLDFYDVFLQPWLNPFSFLMGIFFASICAFLAASFLIGETNGENRKHFSKISAKFTIALVIIGGALFLYGYINNIKFIENFLHNPVSIASVGLSGLLLIPLWKFINNERRLASRFMASLQVFLILFAALYVHFPYLIYTEEKEISLLESTSSASSIENLAITLLIGGLVILPGLFHLMKSFNGIEVYENEK